MMPLVSLSLILSLFLQLSLSLSLSYTKHAHTNAHTYHLLTHSLTCCVFSQGDVDDIEEISEEFEFWYNYYRSLFPKVTTQQIDEFSAKYKNSEEECNDIIENYNKFNGSMTDIMENVMLAEEEDEARISGIIDAAISSSKLKSTPLYTKYKKSNKKNIKKRKDIDLGDENEDDSNHAAAGPSLAALILNKPSNAKNAFDDIFAKYGGGGSDSGKGKKGKAKGSNVYDLDDEEFAKIQSKVLKKK
jgi:DnaJ family protein C protein 9